MAAGLHAAIRRLEGSASSVFTGVLESPGARRIRCGVFVSEDPLRREFAPHRVAPDTRQGISPMASGVQSGIRARLARPRNQSRMELRTGVADAMETRGILTI